LVKCYGIYYKTLTFIDFNFKAKFKCKNKFNKTNSPIIFFHRQKKRSLKLNNKAALKTELTGKPRNSYKKNTIWRAFPGVTGRGPALILKTVQILQLRF